MKKMTIAEMVAQSRLVEKMGNLAAKTIWEQYLNQQFNFQSNENTVIECKAHLLHCVTNEHSTESIQGSVDALKRAEIRLEKNIETINLLDCMLHNAGLTD